MPLTTEHYFHDVGPEVYGRLVSVFEEKNYNGFRWVEFVVDLENVFIFYPKGQQNVTHYRSDFEGITQRSLNLVRDRTS